MQWRISGLREEAEEAVKDLDICNEATDCLLSSKEALKMQCRCFCVILNSAWSQYVLGCGQCKEDEDLKMATCSGSQVRD